MEVRHEHKKRCGTADGFAAHQRLRHTQHGAAFDFCLLRAAPNPTGRVISLVLADIALLGVLDTVVLPYTLYRQVEHGNIDFYR